MNNEQLQKLVEEISLSSFNRPFLHSARFNPRLRTTGGRYFLHSHEIEINPKQYEVHGVEALIAIIKHELCHYHLHIQNKGYTHRDKEFKELLKQVGGARFCQPVFTTIKHSYRCQNCSQKYVRKRRINLTRFVCGKCRGNLMKL